LAGISDSSTTTRLKKETAARRVSVTLGSRRRAFPLNRGSRVQGPSCSRKGSARKSCHTRTRIWPWGSVLRCGPRSVVASRGPDARRRRATPLHPRAATGPTIGPRGGWPRPGILPVEACWMERCRWNLRRLPLSKARRTHGRLDGSEKSFLRQSFGSGKVGYC